MMRLFPILILLLITLLGTGCDKNPAGTTDASSLPGSPQDQVKHTFVAFQQAVSSVQFDKVLALSSTDTVDRFAHVKQQALYANENALVTQDSVRQSWILALRAIHQPLKLSLMTPEAVYQLLSHRMILFPVPQAITDLDLGEIRVNGDEALADLQVKRMPVNVGPSIKPREYPFFTSLGLGEDIRFVKEGNDWKLDLESLFYVTGLTLDLYIFDRDTPNLEQMVEYTRSLLNAPLSENILSPPLWTSPATDDALDAYQADNYARAVDLAKQEADKGYSKAYLLLQMIYADDDNPNANPDQAVKWQLKCMEALNGSALHDYALDVARDPSHGVPAAIPWMEKAADAGNVPAMIYLAEAYRDGKGVSPDRDTARTWYSACAALDGWGCYDALMQLPAE